MISNGFFLYLSFLMRTVEAEDAKSGCPLFHFLDPFTEYYLRDNHYVMRSPFSNVCRFLYAFYESYYSDGLDGLA